MPVLIEDQFPAVLNIKGLKDLVKNTLKTMVSMS